MTFINHARSAALGKPAEQITPTPQPETKQPSEGAPAAPQKGFISHGSELPPSDRGPVAPAFRALAASLNAELAADEAIRHSKVSEALGGMSDQEKLAAHREALAEAVKAGDMTEAEAHALWARQHADIDPATLRPRGK
jgi:hypothetical protein